MQIENKGVCGRSRSIVALCFGVVGLGGCASSMSTTGEPGVRMGDSYAQVFAVVSRNNTVTKEVEGQGFRAEGYSPTFRDCRSKYFIFQGVNGLQQVRFEPAPQLSVNQNCRQP
ncbi:hypothetical protein [Pseudomonas sp. MWU13-2105]|uniref:hypothetical protein n=1 Tax=Pseudomonas sp. MWU13-2105 TaxID=2935074 RepID=UPI00200F597B|nr:hypothetical protein [Pseudomonas sp. MWU13-2105]